MRGEVLKPDDADGPGLILGQDGKRYHFITARVHKQAALGAGTPVDFIALGEEARDIYTLALRPPEPEAPVFQERIAAGGPAKADSLFKYFRQALTRNYFRFQGRARRAEYWGFVLFQILTLCILLILDSMITALVYGTTDPDQIEFLPILSGLLYIYCIIPGIAITVRRLHDRDLTGWLYLMNGVPYIGGIIVFILMCLDSTRLPNKHGTSPKYGGQSLADAFS